MKPKPNSEKGFAIGVVLIILAVLVAAGLVIYQKYLPPKGPSIPSATPVATVLPSSQPEGGDWLTFSQPDVPYTFKYPQNVKLLTGDGYHLSLWGPSQKPETEFYDGIALGFSLPMAFPGGTLKEYVQAKVQGTQDQGLVEIVKPLEETTVNGLPGYTYTTGGLGTFQNIFVLSPDSKWVVEISNATQDPTHQGYTEIVKQILATFKFK